MIPVALIVLALTLCITGKMPLAGARVRRGIEVRVGGVFLLAVGVGAFFLQSKPALFFTIGGFALYALAYCFAPGQPVTEKEAAYRLFSTKNDALRTFRNAGVAFLLGGIVFGLLGLALFAITNFFPIGKG